MHFRLFRIPITVTVSHVLFSAVIAFSFAQAPSSAARWPGSIIAQHNHPNRALTLTLLVAVWMAIITVSVLIHELGHATAAKRFGYQPEITLVGLGGQTSASGTESLRWWQDVLYTLAGPSAGLALGVVAGVSLLVWRWLGVVPDAAQYVLENVFFANLFWTVLNLLPLSTLDGGRITSTVATRLFGRPGFLAAQVLSLALSFGLLLFAAKTGQIFLAALVVMLALRTVSNITGYMKGELPLGTAAHPLLVAVARAETVAQEKNFPEAERIARQVLAEDPPPVVKSRAHVLLGWVALKQGNGRQALDHFSQVQGVTVPPHALAAAFSLIGDETRALPLWAQAAHETRDETILHELAGALLRAGREPEARALPNVKPALAFAAAERVLYVRGEYTRAAQMAEAAFHEAPSPTAAYDAACAFARAGNVTEAMRLLTLASQNGFAETSTATNDPDLASLRNHPAFREWLSSLPASSAR